MFEVVTFGVPPDLAQCIALTVLEMPPCRSSPTLVVAPPAVLNVWEKQVNDHVCSSVGVRLATFHRQFKKDAIAKIRAGETDLVLTTYATLAKEAASESSALFTTNWHRVILDEAHNIRNGKTKSAKACMKLKSKFRWCVTATPITNSPTDLGTLLEFIRVPPLDVEESVFRKLIGHGLSGKKSYDDAKVALARLRSLTSHVVLRRLKGILDDDGSALPPKESITLDVTLDTEARALYSDMARQLREQIDSSSEVQVLRNYMKILERMTRLRQVCCTPVLLGKDDRQKRDLFDKFGFGAKATALVAELQRVPANEKVVIFAEHVQFLHHLQDSIQHALAAGELIMTDGGDTTERYEGSSSMSFTRRKTIIDLFNSDEEESPRILLASLKSAGVGIELTRANHVFLMQPYWNEPIENQAIDRTYRIGQTRPVRVVRFITRGSIEQRMVEWQQRKSTLATGALTRLTKKEQDKLKVDQIREWLSEEDLSLSE